MTAPSLEWTAPDAGSWEWQGSHIPHAPTPVYAALHLHALPTGIAKVFERYGVPLRTIGEALVNGRMYTSMRGLVGQPGASAPPAPVLWLASRLHPEFRRRNRIAAAALADRIWRARTHEWHAELRPALRRANLDFQAEPIEDYDGPQLADHVRRLHQHVVDGHILHFDLHGDDMGPLGLYLAACRDWGIEPGDAIAALTGHSPSTTAAVDALRKVAVAVGSVGAPSVAERPRSLDELRALAPAVASALDDYLEEYGWRVVTGYDLDATTIVEMPDVLLNNLWSLPPDAAERSAAIGDAAAAALRSRVPVGEQVRFDDVLAEARVALDLRDDNGPMTVEWPVGLLRRAMLEVGRRAVHAGALAAAEHALELELHELLAVAAGAAGPGAALVVARADRRRELSAAVPPLRLGPVAEPPPLALFPKPLATVTDMAITCTAHLERSATADAPGELRGLGVGAEAYEGVARVAHTPEEALASMEPGEVLVVPFTTPAYNAVLAVAGGLVTEEGGALSHAAVLARELGLPAVVGVPAALAAIHDGDVVVVDPTTGEVQVR